MSNVSSIAAGKTDKQRADEIKARLRPILEQACVILAEAQADGLKVTFGVGPDAFGRQSVTSLDVVKPL